MYIYVCKYEYTYIYVYMCRAPEQCVVCMHSHHSTYAHILKNMTTHAQPRTIHTPINTLTHALTRTHSTHVHTCAHMCTQMHTRAHTCTHTHLSLSHSRLRETLERRLHAALPDRTGESDAGRSLNERNHLVCLRVGACHHSTDTYCCEPGEQQTPTRHAAKCLCAMCFSGFSLSMFFPFCPLEHLHAENQFAGIYSSNSTISQEKTKFEKRTKHRV